MYAAASSGLRGNLRLPVGGADEAAPPVGAVGGDQVGPRVVLVDGGAGAVGHAVLVDRVGRRHGEPGTVLEDHVVVAMRVSGRSRGPSAAARRATRRPGAAACRRGSRRGARPRQPGPVCSPAPSSGTPVGRGDWRRSCQPTATGVGLSSTRRRTTSAHPPQPVVARVRSTHSDTDPQARISPAVTPAHAQTSASSGSGAGASRRLGQEQLAGLVRAEDRAAVVELGDQPDPRQVADERRGDDPAPVHDEAAVRPGDRVGHLHDLALGASRGRRARRRRGRWRAGARRCGGRRTSPPRRAAPGPAPRPAPRRAGRSRSYGAGARRSRRWRGCGRR